MNHELIDSFGRRINYLRISLTEACNFRCVYCMPSEGLPLQSASQYLHADEIARCVTIAGSLGITHVRLTGGEPLLRRDIVDIVRKLKGIKTVEDLSITTNGSLLRPLIQPLKEAGLDRINISLDSLDPKRFQEVTLSDSYQEVFASVQCSLEAGFPVKLNMVVLKGVTAQDIVAFVQLAYNYPLEVRFLEFMPLCGSGWAPDLFYPLKEIRSIVTEHFLLREVPRGGRVAQTYHIQGGLGCVGFIGSLTESFCRTCSRMRLSSDGKLFPCLFSKRNVSVRDILRSGGSDDTLSAAFEKAARIKTQGNGYDKVPFQPTEDKSSGLSLATPFIRKLGG